MIAPVEASTVATPGVPEDHVPLASPLEVNVVDPFAQISCVPLKTPALATVTTT